MERALICFTLCLLVSCGQNSKSNKSVYLAGEVVNPTSDYVLLYKDDKVVDSTKLNQDNTFTFNLPTIEDGLHSFYHAPQYQYVYLEKGDSLTLRLNTVAFDESLVFSGTSEAVNNFLLEMFLNYEDEEQLIFSYYQLPPDQFGIKIDSLRSQKLEELSVLEKSDNVSEEAYKMAKASIDYNSYIYKEQYPFIHKAKSGEETVHNLDDDFYAYRKNLNVNDGNLTYFKPYYNYVNNRFGNLSYMICVQNCGLEKMMAMEGRLHLNEHKMQVIDSLVTDKDLRNNLFRTVTMNYLLQEHETTKDCDEFIALFDKLSTNEEHITEINKVYNNIKRLQPGEEIPDLYVFNIEGDSLSLKDISRGKKTLFYYWRGSQNRYFRNVLREVNKLKTEHHEYNFVGINLKTSDKLWHEMLEEHIIGDMSTNNQFRADDFKKIQDALVIQNVRKCLVTNDTLIVDAFNNVFTPNLLAGK